MHKSQFTNQMIRDIIIYVIGYTPYKDGRRKTEDNR